MRSIGRLGGHSGSQILVVVLGCAAILVMLFLASWMNTRCWNSSQGCDEQDTFQH